MKKIFRYVMLLILIYIVVKIFVFLLTRPNKSDVNNQLNEISNYTSIVEKE